MIYLNIFFIKLYFLILDKDIYNYIRKFFFLKRIKEILILVINKFKDE